MKRLLVVVLLLSACAPAPTPAKTPTATVPLSQRALAVVAASHLGEPYAAYDAGSSSHPDAIATALYFRAKPGADPYEVSVQRDATRPSFLASDPPGDLTCDAVRSESPAVENCSAREGVLVFSGSRLFVLAHLHGGYVWASGSKTVSAEQLIALAKDDRIADQVSADLDAEAQGFKPWRDDPQCKAATKHDPVPLGAATGAPTAATPQAYAAVIASYVGGVSAGPDSTVYLDADPGESVSAIIEKGEARCASGLEECTTRGDVTIGYLLDVPDESAREVRLVRSLGDGTSAVVSHRSRKADPATKTFPVSLDTLLALVRDERLTSKPAASVIQAGETLPLCWRVVPPSNND